MKKLGILLLLLFVVAGVRAQNYSELWKSVEIAAKDDLPKTALSQVNHIGRLARQNGNEPQAMRALLMAAVYAEAISPDSANRYVRQMVQALAAETRPVQRALWHSALGMVYSHRGDDVSPMPLLSAHLPHSEAEAHFKASLAEMEPLAEAHLTDWLPLFQPNSQSRYFSNDLLHLLLHTYREQAGRQAADLPATYGRAIACYRRMGNRSAELLLTLDSLSLADNGFPVQGDLRQHPLFRQLLDVADRFEQLPINVRTYEQLLQLGYAENSAAAPANDSLLVDLARRGVDLYGQSAEADHAYALQNFIRLKQSPSAHLEGWPSVLYPSVRQTFTLTARNLTEVKLRITPVFDSRADYDRRAQQSHGRFLQKLLAANRKRATTQTFAFHRQQPWKWQRSNINWQAPAKPGVYVAELLVQGKPMATHVFSVSAVSVLAFSSGSLTQRLTVVDSRSGHPQPGARVAVYTADHRSRLKIYEASDSGTLYIDVPRSRSYSYTYYASVGTDYAAESFNLPGTSYSGTQSELNETRLDLFTDRAIYRPGQDLSFTGVVYRRQGDHMATVNRLRTKVSLYNANNKCIDSLQLSTDDWGNLSGTFCMPATCLPGHFSLRVQAPGVCGVVSFRVEEYKRPTFTVATTEPRADYAPGDTVQLCGKAQTYSGIPIAGARVQYRVSRSVWGWRSSAPFEPQSGEVRTDSLGRFALPVWLAAEADSHSPYSRYYFRVSYAVTADNGETVQGEATLPLANRPARYTADLPPVVCKEQLPDFTVSLVNAAGQNLPEVLLFDLRRDSVVCLRDTLHTGRPFRLSALAHLPSGAYVLSLPSVRGAQADTLRFNLYSVHDRRPAFGPTPFFFDNRPTQAGDSVRLTVGSSEQGVCLFYDLVANNQILTSRRYELTDSLLHLDLAYRPEYGDGAIAHFALVRDGKCYTAQAQVVKPQPDKRLQLSWQTFRSRLTPGQHEEWVLRVTHPDGTPAEAALMARLYDASLDAFARNDWQFSGLYPYRRLPNAFWSFKAEDMRRTVALDATPPVSLLSITPWNYAHWQYALFAYWPRSLRGNRLYAASAGSVRTATQPEAMNKLEKDEVMIEMGVDAVVGAAAMPAPVRTNFSETAFFCPSLHTDAQGQVRIAFTLPQSMTQWNFTALAYDCDMNNGRLDTTIVARKDFMVELALPRFLRPGDRTTLPVKVTNLTSAPVEAHLVLTLNRTSSDCTPCYEQTQTVNLAAGESRVYGFDYTADATSDGLICRVLATAAQFADGEERYLPVCADRVEVSRTIPFSLTAPGNYSWRIDSLFNRREGQQPRLRVELSSNPAWYAVSSLPVLAGHPDSRSALEWATRFYALALGQRVGEVNPQLLSQINAHPEALGDLVCVQSERLTGDTPWQQQGEAQSQRTVALPQLFDAEWNALNLATAADKLAALQTPSGAWSWYPGMAGNRSITVNVALMLARVQRLAENYRASAQLTKATAYLRGEVADDVKQMKEREARDKTRVKPTDFHFKYLYLLTLIGERPDADACYLLDRLPLVRKDLTMHGKALAAVVLADFGRDAESRLALQSLLEHTVSRPGEGRWFDTPRAEWSWSAYRIPTQCAAIEALAHFGRDAEADAMRLWLLQARRTQLWDTPLATADAVYALLATAGSTYSATALADTVPVYYTLYKGRNVVGANAPSQAQSPAGYFCRTYTGASAVDATTLKVNKRNAGLSWGSVTATFSLQAAEVPTEGKGFSMQRRFEVKRPEGWQLLETGTTLRRGDRVRQVFTLVADRDYDFVSLHSARPACLEPTQPLSGYHWAVGLSTYRVVRDAETTYYIEQVRKGTHVLAEELFVDRSGRYTSGIAEVSCVLAPEFRATAASTALTVE